MMKRLVKAAIKPVNNSTILDHKIYFTCKFSYYHGQYKNNLTAKRTHLADIFGPFIAQKVTLKFLSQKFKTATDVVCIFEIRNFIASFMQLLLFEVINHFNYRDNKTL